MECKLDYRDVLIVPRASDIESRKEVETYNSDTGLGPICAANMDGVGTFEMAEVLSEYDCLTFLNKSYSIDEIFEFAKASPKVFRHCVVTVGTSNRDIENLYALSETMTLPYICVDVANGYLEKLLTVVEELSHTFEESFIIAGNVVTASQTEALIRAGADAVKVGIGPGSVCTTRIQTGVGYPQLSAVQECVAAADPLGGIVIADGGCTTPGDVSKALVAGADMVMLGGMLAGHDEGGGEVITRYFKTGEVRAQTYFHGDVDVFECGWDDVIEERQFVQFYGMSSRAANDKHNGGLREYRCAEGREVNVPYRGSVINTLDDLFGGIRSTCTYVGARSVRDLPRLGRFVRCGDTHNRVYE